MRNGVWALTLPLLFGCSNGDGNATPALFMGGGAHVTSNLSAMPPATWNSASAVRTTASFTGGWSGPSIALTISNVVVPNDVCGVEPLLRGTPFANMFVLEIKVGADSATGDPLPGTFGNDAASAAFALSDATCANPQGTGTTTATDVTVHLQVAGSSISGTADLTFPNSHFTVSFVAPMCTDRPTILGACTTVPECGDAGSATCLSWAN